MTDLETCSWCPAEVPFRSLKEAHDGALICPTCQRAVQVAALRDILSAPGLR